MTYADTDFGTALAMLREGRRVRRRGWHRRGMSLALQVPDAHSKMKGAYIYLDAPANAELGLAEIRVPWVPSQTDLLARDWEVAE